jgi:hypothetical protein
MQLNLVCLLKSSDQVGVAYSVCYFWVLRVVQYGYVITNPLFFFLSFFLYFLFFHLFIYLLYTEQIDPREV